MPFCSPRNGWYTTSAFNQIRAVLKRKIAGLAEGKSRVVGDVECGELLAGDVAPTAEDLEVGQGRRDRAGSGAEEGTPSEAPVASGSKQKQGATLAMDKGKARAQKVPVRGTPMVVVPPLPVRPFSLELTRSDALPRHPCHARPLEEHPLFRPPRRLNRWTSMSLHGHSLVLGKTGGPRRLRPGSMLSSSEHDRRRRSGWTSRRISPSVRSGTAGRPPDWTTDRVPSLCRGREAADGLG